MSSGSPCPKSYNSSSSESDTKLFSSSSFILASAFLLTSSVTSLNILGRALYRSLGRYLMARREQLPRITLCLWCSSLRCGSAWRSRLRKFSRRLSSWMRARVGMGALQSITQASCMLRLVRLFDLALKKLNFATCHTCLITSFDNFW